MEKLPVCAAWCKVTDTTVYDDIENKNNEQTNELKSQWTLFFPLIDLWYCIVICLQLCLFHIIPNDLENGL